jgi:hypothetical protein
MDTPIEYEAQIRQSPEFALRELSAHFDYKNAVWRTLQRLAKNLDEANIPYMLVGAMALNQHGYERATTDVDLIMTAEGLAQFRMQYLGKASGLSAAYRLKDIADTQEMIRALNLPLALADKLDISVRDEYIRLWHTVHDAADPYDEEAQMKRDKHNQEGQDDRI